MGFLSKVFKPVTDMFGKLTGVNDMVNAANQQAEMIQRQTAAQVRQAQEQSGMMQKQQEQIIANQRAADAARTLEQQATVAATPEVSVGSPDTADPTRRRNPRAAFMSARSQGSGISI